MEPPAGLVGSLALLRLPFQHPLTPLPSSQRASILLHSPPRLPPSPRWAFGTWGWCYKMGLLENLTFGALISATDPVGGARWVGGARVRWE